MSVLEKFISTPSYFFGLSSTLLEDVLYLKFRNKKGRFTWSNKKVVHIDIESYW